MAAYLEQVKTALEDFEFYSVEAIPREENALADALARLATSKEAEELSIVPVETLHEPSIVITQNLINHQLGVTITSDCLCLKLSGHF